MSEVDALLRRLGRALGRFDGLERRLPKGATKAALARFAKRLGRRPPPDLLRFLTWHDGTRDVEIDGYHAALSVEGCLRAKRAMDGLISHFEDDWLPDTWWSAGWLPFLDFNGDFVCVDLDGTLGAPGQVISFENYSRARKVLHRSFRDWLAAVVALWEQVPAEADEDERIAFFTGRAGARLRRQVSPGLPVVRNARRRPAPKAPRGLECHFRKFERGPYSWSIERAGALVRVIWGRAYSQTTKRKQLPTIAAAKRFVEREVRAKLRAGHVEVESGSYSAKRGSIPYGGEELLAEAARHLETLS